MKKVSIFESALTWFFDLAREFVSGADPDEEWHNRVESLAKSLRPMPRTVREVKLWQIYEDLQRIGYEQGKADEIVEFISRRVQEAGR